MKLNTKLLLLSFILLTQFAHAQDASKWEFEKKCYVGTQAFMILTPILDPSPEYYQINLGYRFSPKDELMFEAITWRYSGPQGRPIGGPDYENAASDYPGDVKSLGAGLAYKRLLWRGLYTQVHSTAFRQTYRDEKKETLQKGFMLFNTLRLGYHFKILNNKFFLAPSIGATSWPINTNLPTSFQAEEDKWNSFFLGELGFHIGFNF